MALQVWLPLNGTLENKGLSNVTVTNNGATIDNNGKIGKCYSFDGNDDYIAFSGNFFRGGTSYPFSVCMWVYQNDTNRAILFGDFSLSGNLNFNIELKASTNPHVRFYWGGSPDLNLGTIPSSQWVHLCITYDGTTLKQYNNGTLVNSTTTSLSNKTKSSGDFYIGGDSRTGSTALAGKINDFRIYDHALSPKEVKEISKGLILHYKLDGNGKGGDNLLYNTNTANTNLFGFSETTGGSNKTIEYDGWVPCIKVTRNSTAHSGGSYMYHTNLTHSAIKTSTTYTVSFDAIASGSGSIGWSGFMAGNATNSLSRSNEIIQNTFNSTGWSHIILRTTTKSSFDGLSVGGQVVYMSCSFMKSTGVWIKVKNFKVEEGTADTPWCPNSSDALYTTLGYNNTTEYDTSGFGNNGTITGILTTNNNSPRYTKSTVFNGSSGINAGHGAKITDAITISYWAKTSATSGTIVSCTQSGGYGSSYNTNGEYFYLYSNGGYGTVPTYSLWNDNTWHHIACTFDGRYKKVYKDSVLVVTQDLGAKYLIGYNASAPVWIGAESLANNTPTTPYFNGSLSDVRIYATALSEDDVKELYNTSAFLTDNGTLYGYELKETTSSLVNKTGVVETEEFIESDLTTEKMKIFDDEIQANVFNEI